MANCREYDFLSAAKTGNFAQLSSYLNGTVNISISVSTKSSIFNYILGEFNQKDKRKCRVCIDKGNGTIDLAGDSAQYRYDTIQTLHEMFQRRIHIVFEKDKSVSLNGYGETKDIPLSERQNFVDFVANDICNALNKNNVGDSVYVFKANPNVRLKFDTEEEVTALWLSCAYGHVNCVEELLRKEAFMDVDCLSIACENNQTYVISALFQYCSSLISYLDSIATLLKTYIVKGQLSVVQALILSFDKMNHGAMIQRHTSFALAEAIKNRQFHCLEYLLTIELLQPLIQETYENYTPLSLAASRGDSQCVQILLDFIAGFEEKEYRDGLIQQESGHSKENALMICLSQDDKDESESSERLKIVQLLLSASSKLQEINIKGDTALMIACRNKNPEGYVNLLLKEGSETDRKNVINS